MNNKRYMVDFSRLDVSWKFLLKLVDPLNGVQALFVPLCIPKQFQRWKLTRNVRVSKLSRSTSWFVQRRNAA